MPLTTNPSVSNVTGGSWSANIQQGNLTNNGFWNGTTTANTITTTAPIGSGNIVAASRPIMELRQQSEDIAVTFTGEEAGQWIRLQLSPERNITPLEQLFITKLMLAVSHGMYLNNSDVMRFIRAHQLERHFNFSQA